jgi:hypothetical protein
MLQLLSFCQVRTAKDSMLSDVPPQQSPALR